MFDRDLWHEIYITLMRNKMRTILTAFGVGWGIFMLVIMLGAGSGLENGVKNDMGNFATNSLYVWTQSTSIPYKGMPAGRYVQLTNEDTEALIKDVPEIEHIAPRVQLGGWRGGNNVTRGSKTGAFSVNGDYPAIQSINPLIISAGRFLNNNDLAEQRKIAVIGTRVRDILFTAEETVIGSNIEISGVHFKVVGIFSTDKSGEDAERETQSIYIPFTTFQKAFNNPNVDWYAMTAKPGIAPEEVEEKVKVILAARHKVAPEDKRAFGSYNSGEDMKGLNNTFLGIAFITWFVGLCTLIAGAIGVSNIMLVIVKERTKEIGIRRAIGAPPRLIITQIILEATILTIFAGYLGLVVAVGILEGVSFGLQSAGADLQYFKNPEVDFNTAMIALSVLTIAGILAGLIPAYRAVRVKPVDALRSE